MLFNHAGAYAVRALLFLARQPANTRWLASSIAQSEEIPLPTLSKVLVALKGGGFVRASRGPSGGYVLNRSPESITLAEIARLFESTDGHNSCELLLGNCADCSTCPMSGLWDSTRNAVRGFLDTTTLAALVNRASTLESSSARLSDN